MCANYYGWKTWNKVSITRGKVLLYYGEEFRFANLNSTHICMTEIIIETFHALSQFPAIETIPQVVEHSPGGPRGDSRKLRAGISAVCGVLVLSSAASTSRNTRRLTLPTNNAGPQKQREETRALCRSWRWRGVLFKAHQI